MTGTVLTLLGLVTANEKGSIHDRSFPFLLLFLNDLRQRVVSKLL